MTRAERMVVKPSDPFIKADPRMVCRKIHKNGVSSPEVKLLVANPVNLSTVLADGCFLPALMCHRLPTSWNAGLATMMGAANKHEVAVTYNNGTV